MQRLNQLNMHFSAASAPKKQPAKRAKKALKPPTANVWESMGMDQYLSSRAVKMRKDTAKMMDDNY